MPLPTAPAQATPTAGERGATQVRQLAHQSAARMLRDVKHGMNAIWNSPAPGDVLAALGTEAAGVFQLNNDTITFLATTLAGTEYQADVDAILARVEALPAFTINVDGTITLD